MSNTKLATRLTGRMASEQRLFTIALCLMALANVLMDEMPLRSRIGGNDFLSFYAGAHMAVDPALYDPEAVSRFQLMIGWDTKEAPFIRPPFYAMFLWPIGQISFPVAVQVWRGLNIFAVAAFAWMFRTMAPPLSLVAAIFASYPLFASFVAGQDVPFLLAILAGAACLLARGHRFASGLLFSLCFIKFHLLLAVPVILLRRKAWRFSAGLASGAAALLGLSIFLQGPSFPFRYFQLLPQSRVNPSAGFMPNLHGLLPDVWMEIAAGVVVVILCWIASSHSNVRCACAAIAIGGLLLSHHSYTHDASVVLPAGIVLMSESLAFATRLMGLISLCPVLWVMVRVPGLSAIPVLFLVALLALICYESLVASQNRNNNDGERALMATQ